MRPLPTAPNQGPSRDQHRDDSDALPQGTPASALNCFITTESSLESGESGQDCTGVIPGMRRFAQKENTVASMLVSEGPNRLRPVHPSTSSMASSTAEQDRSRPSTPVFASVFGPEPANSIPSSPGGLSSVTMSEDPYSLSASFSELPPSHSPVCGPLPVSARGPIPQLVMPSLTVPQRRPFSEAGRSLGKLKVLVTGQRGKLGFAIH